MKVERVYLSLGSNMGKAYDNLLRAIIMLGNKGLNICDVSSIYETEPIGYENQSSFLNLMLLCSTIFTPWNVLRICQQVELELGRERTFRWGPRTIDIDIILFGDRVITEKDLQIPHPRYKERAFVLVPLKEIDYEKYISLVKTIPDQKVCLKTEQADVKIQLRERGLFI